MNTFESFLEARLLWLGKVLQPERVFYVFLFAAGLIVIALKNSGVFPLPVSYAVFYFVLLILLGLYRPSFLWQTVIFFLPFELIQVASFPAGLDLRAYQFCLMALLFSTAILWIQKKVVLPPLRWFDLFLLLVVLGGTLSFFVNTLPLSSSKDVLILYSFTALYSVGRIYLQKKKQVGIFLHTLLVSGSAVALYAFYQVIAYEHNWTHFMVMTGRPNSVFEEADWLGFFMGIAALVAIIFTLQAKRWYQEVLGAMLLIVFLVTLILTVSRSAWLGFGIGVIAVGLVLAYEYLSGFLHAKPKEVRTLFKFFAGVPITLAVSVGIIFIFQLTRFQLADRFASTGTGDQIITIACSQGSVPPASVASVEVLSSFGCQHINLEEREHYQQDGYTITETARPDPNVSIRRDLYIQTFALIRTHFFFGLGWGESVKAFGVDGRGAGLNSSNIFLEIWLGSGLMGILGFVIFWFGILFAILKRLYHKREMTDGFWLSILMLGLWCQATIFNLFNAGLLLGIFAAMLVLFAWYGEKTVPKISTLWQQ